MKYFKEFEVRWSDLDANRHLANSAFINFMSHTRVHYLWQMGFDSAFMEEHNVGPVVFYEHIYYFKEIFPGKPIRVSFEIKGLSADGMFFEFHHDFYDTSGKHLAHAEIMGGWFSLKTRKLVGMTPDMLEMLNTLEKGDEFRLLTKEDTRKYAKKPIDLV